MKDLIEELHKKGCSLVLKDVRGNIRLFYKKGVRDLEDLLDKEPYTLRGAVIADKVVGKAAAGMMAYGGVSEVYGDVVSRKAVPVLEANDISWSCGVMTDHIVITEGDSRCPLEKIVAPAQDAGEIVSMLREHFSIMRGKK